MELLNTLTTISNNYSDNQRLYNENMRRLLQITEDCVDLYRARGGTAAVTAAPPAARAEFQEPAAVAAELTRQTPEVYLSSPLLLRTLLRNLQTRNYNFVFRDPGDSAAAPRIPNTAQLNRAIETVTYMGNESDIVCPITLNSFTVGQSISRIRGCGHIFHPNALNRWFTQNCVCPVCRYNIIDSAAAASSSSAAAADTEAAAPTDDEEMEEEEDEEDGAAADTQGSQSMNFFRQMINLLDSSGVSISDLETQLRRTDNGNVLDILYEINFSR
jgi:predicted  nucleic acid-binding Zn-ribbon protein